VPWNDTEGQFHCPCHGSLYNRFGEVIGGPAPRPLDLMKVTVEGGNVQVDSGEITVRTSYDPSQAVKAQ
jgi:cytochrome b6-f complex iron-sulfur subunit